MDTNLLAYGFLLITVVICWASSSLVGMTALALSTLVGLVLHRIEPMGLVWIVLSGISISVTSNPAFPRWWRWTAMSIFLFMGVQLLRATRNGCAASARVAAGHLAPGGVMRPVADLFAACERRTARECGPGRSVVRGPMPKIVRLHHRPDRIRRTAPAIQSARLRTTPNRSEAFLGLADRTRRAYRQAHERGHGPLAATSPEMPAPAACS
jgi:hypothetical protein